MAEFRFRFLFIFTLCVPFILLMIGCNTDPELEVTTQALVEEIISTNTPTPTETMPPTETNTPLPPTSTPTTEPTTTPVPPTTTPTPIILEEDQLQDEINCDTQQLVEDPEVDIASIMAFQREDTLQMQVILNDPLVRDYSFAVLLTLGSEDIFNYYVWEVHETVPRIGQIDSQTGELLAATTGGALMIDHNRTDGVVSFTIPISYTAVTTATETLTNSIIISGTGVPLNQIYISSFHTPEMDQPKHCDTAGPYEFPGGSS